MLSLVSRWAVPILCVVTSLPSAAGAAFGPLLTSSNLGNGTSAVSEILSYDPIRGGFLGVVASDGGLSRTQGIAFGPDGMLYAASAQTGQILRFDPSSGKLLGVFATVPSPVGITFGPNSDLYVVSNTPDGVLRCDHKTGACFAFVTNSGNSLSSPFMAVFGPDGNLYVSSTVSGEVLRFDGSSGAYHDVFASGNGLLGPTGLLFTPDGSLLVSDAFQSQILSFSSSGSYIGVFSSGGPLDGPSQLLLGPNNEVYVANTFAGSVLRYALATGSFIDTLLPNTASGPGAVNFLAFAPALPSPTVSSNGISDGIVNAASFTGGSVSPGEILTIFGSNIGPSSGFIYQIESATGNIAPYSSGTRVLFDGTPSPVLFTRHDQVSVIVPYEVFGKSQVSIQVEYLGQTSPAINLPVALSTPGIFTAATNGSGQGAILLSDGVTPNSASHPAPKGSIVSIFATGAGQTNPSGVDGSFTSAAPPAPAQAVSVTIGGITVPAVYAGGSPGSVAGLLQVNAMIPANAPSGDVPVTIRIGAASSQPGVTVAVQ